MTPCLLFVDKAENGRHFDNSIGGKFATNGSAKPVASHHSRRSGDGQKLVELSSDHKEDCGEEEYISSDEVCMLLSRNTLVVMRYECC